MHTIKNVYLTYYLTNKYDTCMHDLVQIYEKVLTSLKVSSKQYFDIDGNYKFYPNKPKMPDIAIIALSITAECLEICSENLLFSKIKSDYLYHFPNLIHRASYNRRRKQLHEIYHICLNSLSDLLNDNIDSSNLIIDSIPIPIIKIVREKSSTICRKEGLDEVLAKKAYNPVLNGYYIGYKLHLITTDKGIYRDYLITSANQHDNIFLKCLNKDDMHLKNQVMLGDRAYIGNHIQTSLFEELNLEMKVPYRRNQYDYKPYSSELKIKRKTIEVVFAQYCDEFNLRKNYAKRFGGFEIRIVTKILAKTFKQYYNFVNGKEINRTKHSLAA